MRNIVYYVDVLMRLVPPESLEPKVRLRQRIEQVHKVPWRSQMYFDGETAIVDGKYQNRYQYSHEQSTGERQKRNH
jgi:hypothetical protein